MARPSPTEIRARLSKQLPARWTRPLRTRVLAAGAEGADEGSKILLSQLKRDWPSKSRAVHVYATNRSVEAWQRRRISSYLWWVSNHAEGAKSGRHYVRYTRLGYTQEGPGRARSYRRRGSTPYDHAAGRRAAPRIQKAWVRALRRHWRR